MDVNIGCIVVKDGKILLVKEQDETHKQLQKWNLISGNINEDEFIFNGSIMRVIEEETGVRVDVKGIVGLYESNTPKGKSLYIVIGCNGVSDKIRITDSDIIDVKWFDLEEFWNMSEDVIVHEDMHVVVQSFLDGKYIDLVRSVRYE